MLTAGRKCPSRTLHGTGGKDGKALPMFRSDGVVLAIAKGHVSVANVARLIIIKYIGEGMWILSEATWILLIPQVAQLLYSWEGETDNTARHLSCQDIVDEQVWLQQSWPCRFVYRARFWPWS